MNRSACTAIVLLTARVVAGHAQGSAPSERILGGLPEASGPDFQVTRTVEGNVVQIGGGVLVLDVASGNLQTFRLGTDLRLEVDKRSVLAGRSPVGLTDFARRGLDVRVTFSPSDGVVRELKARRPRTEKVRGRILAVGPDGTLRIDTGGEKRETVHVDVQTRIRVRDAQAPAGLAGLAEGTSVEVEFRASDRVAVEVKPR